MDRSSAQDWLDRYVAAAVEPHHEAVVVADRCREFTEYYLRRP